MSPKIAFALVFLLVFGITLLVPSLPPAQFLSDLLKIPQNTTSILGVSVTVFLNGIANGFFWLAMGAIVYGAVSLVSRREPLPPMPEAPHLKSPLPESTLVDQRTSKIPPAITVRKPPVKPRLTYEIEAIEGIGPIRGELLRNLGIKTVDDLLRAGSSNLARRQVAKEVGVSDEILLKWINRGDLLRVRGVGKQYSELLEAAGVISVNDLSTRSPSSLYRTLKVINNERNLVKRVPFAKTIRTWVYNARNLEPVPIQT
jgi:predicted flap endonuclease-1-like 5' DNA nuclease